MLPSLQQPLPFHLTSSSGTSQAIKRQELSQRKIKVPIAVASCTKQSYAIYTRSPNRRNQEQFHERLRNIFASAAFRVRIAIGNDRAGIAERYQSFEPFVGWTPDAFYRPGGSDGSLSSCARPCRYRFDGAHRFYRAGACG